VLARLALEYIPSRAVAEEVVQETWLGVIRGIGRFEGARPSAPGSFASW
jgi:RNA polymerase sigma-70 factor, ECF subfamily